MTARDELKTALRRGGAASCYSDIVIDAFAHELAEKIRDENEASTGTVERLAVVRAHGAALADLIDPDVTDTGDFAVGDTVTVTGPLSGTAIVTAVGVVGLLVIDQLTKTERSVFKSDCRKT